MKFPRKTFWSTAITAFACIAALAPAASALPRPAWHLTLRSQQTNFKPGQTFATQIPKYLLTAENVGAAATTAPLTLKLQLPEGINLAAGKSPSAGDQHHATGGGTSCSAAARTITCTDVNPVAPGEWAKMEVPLDIDSLPDPTVLETLATVSGGGADPATSQISTTISNTPPPFGFLAGYEGFNASTSAEDGTAAGQAGTHPQEMTVNFSVSSKTDISNASPLPNGTLKDVKVDLPTGLIVDPSATPKCTQEELVASLGCPEAAQVGTLSVPLQTGAPAQKPLYNMVAPPGHAADFAANIGEIPVHILGGVRPEGVPGSYRITSLSPDALSLLTISAARVQLWGSPSDKSHDAVRGDCGDVTESGSSATCPVSRTDKPLLSLPTSCTDSMRIDAHLSLWEEPHHFYDRQTSLSDANGNTTEVSGCSSLAGTFNPTLKARPTTNVADSPTGLQAGLHIPLSDSVGAPATPHLRKAVVTLPKGLVLNPASANGLDSCDSEEVGIDLSTGVPNGNPVSCPDASRIGTVEVDTPLLEHPLPGSVFVATPHDNPFDSLLAIYLVVDDQPTNTLIKLAGHVVPDPKTGQLVTTFDDNPQLPFEDFKLDFFGGAYAVLRTPATCGTYSTTSQMTPWSAPDSGPPATPKDSWQISQGPGGSCATTQAALPNTPSFDAGSASVIAGAHTPFVLHLRRGDATQQFSALTVSPPPGLVAKLAGTTPCSDSALEAATHKSGGDEKKTPSCPSTSQVGSFTAATGSGPSPYYATGKVYLSGPYKSAPLSFSFITPAVAGPYDLGTIVTRAAVYLDRETARVTTVSDPLPEILEGIPLDVRSVDVSLDRPDFTRNGTSCDPLSVDGTLTSTLGQSATLSNRFQLAECRRLAFKPKLKLSLKGATKRTGNPRLIANLNAKEGEANIAKAQVKLPGAAFLDNSHIGTVCTRVQFAADQCPEGSIYGQASATSPILDYAVSGPVYLRSNPEHELPDLVVKLKGPESQPIEVDLAGKTDSVKGALRNTFEAVPDVPVSQFHLELFGGHRGLVELSKNLCKGTYRAAVRMDAQNGATYDTNPVVGDSCKGGKKRGKRHPR